MPRQDCALSCKRANVRVYHRFLDFRLSLGAAQSLVRPVASSESSNTRQAGAMGAPAYLPSIYEVAEVKVRCNAVSPEKPSELRVYMAQEVT